MPVPASRMRGPGTLPAAMASRSASVTPSLSPRLRTVVKPASSVLRALTARLVREVARRSFVSDSTSPSWPALSLSRCT